MSNENTTTTGDLAAIVAEAAGIPRDQAKRAIDATTDAIGAQLAEGRSVQLTGFGTFEPKQAAARSAPDLSRPGQRREIPAKTRANFRAADGLQQRISQRGQQPQPQPNRPAGTPRTNTNARRR